MTLDVINSLREVKPTEIFVVADGPKNSLDAERCKETRLLVGHIDWKCKIYKIYSPVNLGLRKRVVSGLNYVFSKVDRAIILEDDLVINKSFYKFCEQMLEKYKNNSEIISVAGNNFLFGKHKINESYYFSHHIYSWGWATWRRAWKLYDDKMIKWPKIKKSGILKDKFDGIDAYVYWTGIFELTYQGAFNSWAYAWTYTAFIHNMLSVIPSVNLVSNVGVGHNATHTTLKSRVLELPTKKIIFPLKHPKAIHRDVSADSIIERILYVTPRNATGLIVRYLQNYINKLK